MNERKEHERINRWKKEDWMKEKKNEPTNKGMKEINDLMKWKNNEQTNE